MSLEAENLRSYLATRRPIALARPRRSLWHPDTSTHSSIAQSAQTGFLFTSEGKLIQGISHFLLDGNTSLFDDGAAVNVTFWRNEEVEDCAENRALARQTDLDWKTMQEVLQNIETKCGWTTNVTVETVSDGGFYFDCDLHKYHFVGKPLPKAVVIERIPISELQIWLRHNQSPHCFVVRTRSQVVKFFKLSEEIHHLLDELEFFTSLPECDYLCRPTHAVVDDSGALRGILLDFQHAGGLPDFYRYLRLNPTWVNLPRLGSIPAPLLDEVLIPWDAKLGWAIDFAAATAWLHERGIFCSDLGAHNIALCDDGRCRLIDYFPNPNLSAPNYVPPEFTMENSRQLTAERAVFALGVGLWVVAEEVSLFQRDYPGPPYPPPALPWRQTTPNWYIDLVSSCIAESPLKRPTARSIVITLLSHVGE
ncbi:Protein kinase domain-containing protein [Mycena kentingensis (nom. inval.)]|nr:Protein kinase domain-containing protein [Mycena kentingensis (nom. inval.)]